MDELIELLAEILILAAFFSVLERYFCSNNTTPWYKRSDMATDLSYYLFNSIIVNGVLKGVVIIMALVLTKLILGMEFGEVKPLIQQLVRADIQQVVLFPSFSAWLNALPLWQQVFLGLILADLLSYWGHRWFHGKRLWPLHAVHHSPPILDWLSSVRVHPINELTMSIIKVTPLLLLGFKPIIFVVITPIIGFWSVLSHANVDWDFGPIKYLVITPKFHRWHHTSERQGLDKNFAGLFPIYDILFGTWYMPDRSSSEFGTGETKVPAGFWRQLGFPFYQSKRKVTLAKEMK